MFQSPNVQALKYSLVLLSILSMVAVLAQENTSPLNNFNASFGGAAGSDTSGQNAVLALEKAQQRADEHYKAKRYERAYNMYKTLAEYGDKFSQYRIAFMHQQGFGVEQSLTEAFAWSYLAAEAGDAGFVKYHLQIRGLLKDDELQPAKQLAGKYLQDHGIYAQASRARGLISKEMRKCSGSRTGNTCNKVTSSGWNCGLSGADDVPAANCLTLGMVGIPGLAGLQPADLRKTQKNLAQLEDKYNPGRVELGELELIDD